MFRDTYKAANNDIAPDKEFAAGIISLAQQSPKRVIPIRAIATCAAAFAIMAGSVYGYVRYSDYMTLDTSPKVVVSDHTENTTNNLPPQVPQTEETIRPYVKKSTESQSATQTNPVQTPQINSQNIQPQVPDTDTRKSSHQNISVANEQSKSEPDTSSVDTAGDILSDTPSPQENNNLIMSRLMPANMYTAEPDTETNTQEHQVAPTDGSTASVEEITYDDYCGYIGRDLYKDLNVPKDLIPLVWATTETDKTNPKATFTYTGTEDRFVQITTTADTKKVYELIDNADTTSKTPSSAISYSYRSASAYIVTGNTGYIVYGTGLSENEFTLLVNSVKQ